MASKSPCTIVLSETEKAESKKRAAAYAELHYRVIRAKTVLPAAEGIGNRAIGKKLDVPVQNVSKWRNRFFEERIDGLDDRQRPGGPAGFSP